jgi:hypothetical protein
LQEAIKIDNLRFSIWATDKGILGQAIRGQAMRGHKFTIDDLRFGVENVGAIVKMVGDIFVTRRLSLVTRR